jgi:hypothetical protein
MRQIPDGSNSTVDYPRSREVVSARGAGGTSVPATSHRRGGSSTCPQFRYGARPAPYRWSPKCGDRCSHSSALTVPGRSQRRTPPGMASAGHRNCTRYLNIGELRGSAPRCGGSDPGVRPRLRARNPSDQRRSWLRRVATLPSRPSSFCCLLARLARCGEVPPRRVGVQFSRFSGWVFQ